MPPPYALTISPSRMSPYNVVAGTGILVSTFRLDQRSADCVLIGLAHVWVCIHVRVIDRHKA
jgi:hypothetical protein